MLLVQSYESATGKQLVPGVEIVTAEDAHARVWSAPFCLLSHGTEASPVFNYGNASALKTFEISWDALLCMESRYTAPPMRREERENLLDRVKRHGFIDNYEGTRITAKGSTFEIKNAVVWEFFCPRSGLRLGQAAMFEPPS
jgi:hypothetical protein